MKNKFFIFILAFLATASAAFAGADWPVRGVGGGAMVP